MYGNSNSRTDFDDGNVTFIDDPTDPPAEGMALTGTGARSTWAGSTNLTTHAGTTAGVFDLKGNAWEWTGSVGLAQTTGNWIVSDVTLPLSAPGSDYISELATDPRLRRFGVPGATSGGPEALFGNDTFSKTLTLTGKAIRGMGWGDPAAGIWIFSVSGARSVAYTKLGFRPALRY